MFVVQKAVYLGQVGIHGNYLFTEKKKLDTRCRLNLFNDMFKII